GNHRLDSLFHDRRRAGEKGRHPGARASLPVRGRNGDERLRSRLVVEEPPAAAVDLAVDEGWTGDAVALPTRCSIPTRLSRRTPRRDATGLDPQGHAAAHPLTVEEHRRLEPPWATGWRLGVGPCRVRRRKYSHARRCVSSGTSQQHRGASSSAGIPEARHRKASLASRDLTPTV